MPQILSSSQNVLSAVDYFKAKLQFESTPHELKALLGKPSVLVLDVRDPKSYGREHIQGAVNIPLEEISKKLKDLPKDKTIVAYCWNITCHMATKAALELAHKDYKVQELEGGIEAWKKAGFPVEGAPQEAQAQERWEGEGGKPAKS